MPFRLNEVDHEVLFVVAGEGVAPRSFCFRSPRAVVSAKRWLLPVNIAICTRHRRYDESQFVAFRIETSCCVPQDAYYMTVACFTYLKMM